MYKFIVTAEEIDIIIMLIKKNRRGFFYEFIEFDNVKFAIRITIEMSKGSYVDYLEDQDLINYWRKIFSRRSLLQIKNALTELGLINYVLNRSDNTISCSMINHEFDNICMNRLFNAISSINDKTNDVSDKLNILTDVLDLKQVV